MQVDALLQYCLGLGYTEEQLFYVPRELAGPDCPDFTPFMDPNFQASVKQLLDRATKEGFSEFFAGFMNKFGRKKYGNVPSPYDV